MELPKLSGTIVALFHDNVDELVTTLASKTGIIFGEQRTLPSYCCIAAEVARMRCAPPR